MAETLSLGSILYEAEVTGERLIWLEASAVNKFAAILGPGEVRNFSQTLSPAKRKGPRPKWPRPRPRP